MTFIQSIKTCFSKYAIFDGRASRSEYWWFQLFSALLQLGLGGIGIIIGGVDSFDVTSSLGWLVTVTPAVVVGARRLHDTGKSGLYYFWSLVPFIGTLIVLAFMLGDGTKGRNQYGDNPLKKSKKKK